MMPRIGSVIRWDTAVRDHILNVKRNIIEGQLRAAGIDQISSESSNHAARGVASAESE